MLTEVLNSFRKTDSLCTEEINRETLVNLINDIWAELEKEGVWLYYPTYADVKMYNELLDYMPTYDTCFVQDKFIPFLREHMPVTLTFLDLTVAFYALVVYDLSRDGVLSVSDKLKSHLEELGSNVFEYGLCFLTDMGKLGRGERTMYPCGFEVYLSDEMYLLIEKKIMENFNGSPFEKALEKILGQYNIRFSFVKYITEYQTLFARVANHYQSIYLICK